jgi:DNA-binding MarR family transcriptional regulator
VTSRELADTAGLPVSSVVPKLQALVKSGLARRHWGPHHSPGRTYSITDEGEDLLTRLERKL